MGINGSAEEIPDGGQGAACADYRIKGHLKPQ